MTELDDMLAAWERVGDALADLRHEVARLLRLEPICRWLARLANVTR